MAFWPIAENAGQEGSVVVNKVREGGLGYNAATNTYEDLLAAGVVDLAKVTRSALQNAASIAGLLLTTEALIAGKPEKGGGAPTGGGGMPGGRGGFQVPCRSSRPTTERARLLRATSLSVVAVSH